MFGDTPRGAAVFLVDGNPPPGSLLALRRFGRDGVPERTQVLIEERERLVAALAAVDHALLDLAAERT